MIKLLANHYLYLALDALVDEIVSDLMDNIRIEKHDPSQDCRRIC